MSQWPATNANYFVDAHRTSVLLDQPVLNVISGSELFFSASNAFIGKPDARGHFAAALARNKLATVVLIPGAPHALLDLPAARHATLGFVLVVLRAQAPAEVTPDAIPMRSAASMPLPTAINTDAPTSSSPWR